jgi:hypothetical protein
MENYRQRIRQTVLRPVQIGMPDTRAAEFVEICRQQACAVAAHDPAGDEILRFVAELYELPAP